MMKVLRCGYHVKENKDLFIDRPQGTTDYILILFLAPMEVTIKGKKMPVASGSAVVFEPECAHTIRGIDGFANSYTHFVGDTAREVLEELHMPINTIFPLKDCMMINELHKRLEIELIIQQKFWEQEAEAILSEMLIALAREVYKETESDWEYGDLEMIFHKVRIAIHTDLKKQWTIQEMAGMTGFGKTRFYHYYELFFGISPKEDLIQARLEKAKYLLTNKALTIQQAAEMSGFENTCHFTRSFKKSFQVSPSSYHQYHKGKGENV